MCAINLIPDTCRHARQRAQRLRRWLGVVGALGVVLAAPWLWFVVGQTRVEQLESRIAEARARHVELDRQYRLLARRRGELLARFQTVVTPTDTRDLAASLGQLTVTAPRGVMLTRLSLSTGARGVSRRPQPGVARRSPVLGDKPNVGRRLQFEGLALDHHRLQTLMRALEQLPHCQQVTLVRSQRHDADSGTLQSFALECRWEETRP